MTTNKVTNATAYLKVAESEVRLRLWGVYLATQGAPSDRWSRKASGIKNVSGIFR